MIIHEIEITLIEKKLRKTINQYFFKKNNVER
jgi:hypothetical protein